MDRPNLDGILAPILALRLHPSSDMIGEKNQDNENKSRFGRREGSPSLSTTAVVVASLSLICGSQSGSLELRRKPRQDGGGEGEKMNEERRGNKTPRGLGLWKRSPDPMCGVLGGS